MPIAEVLGATLAEKAMTQGQAAALLGVQQPTVNRWVSGKDTPSDDHVPALVKLTGLKRAEVLEALHSQRVAGRSMATRVAALEATVATMQAEQREVLALLRELQSTDG